MNILITDPIEQRCVDILQAEGLHVDVHPGMPPKEIESAIVNYEGLIVRSGTQVTGEIIGAGKRLKVVGRAGAGVDNIDVGAATRRGIIVMNTPGGNTVSTAEHTISLMLALARNIPQAHGSLQQGVWDRKRYLGTELSGKTVGIVGVGKVGREVAKRCAAFELAVVGYDPVLTPEAATKMNIQLVDFEELLRRSDFITIHTPLNEETKGLLNKQSLARCKPGVRIINCARGGIVDEGALLEALNSGHVAGAALDVFEHEPPGNHPLLHHPKVVATPHLGASTEEAQEKVAVQIAQQVADALLGRGVSGSVNGDAIQMALRSELQPYLELAEKMGKLTAQLMQGKLRALTVTTCGDILEQSSSVLTAAVLKGIFETVLSEPVNYINAPVIARERGILPAEEKKKDHDVYVHLLRVTFETDKETRSLAGTVFGRHNVRIVGVDTFHFEINPEGYLLFYSNVDRPGMLAAVGAILAEENINIGGVALGRYGIGKQALTIMSLDGPISQPVLNRISMLKGISDAKLVNL